ncbi:hypothetical protein [Streptomyces brasiliscabiei]|uniref:hypothetical protein n=1 Tax=Streptomyces brasiliscabiei TaxID=2736302 RepID=UPI001C10DC89|nr:hypothetical protein [Streptomyces brasiliscabiei]
MSDADELIRRIANARDWAKSEEDRFEDLANRGLGPDGEPGRHGAIASASWSNTYNAIRAVLDEIVEPGKHSAS